MKITDLQVWVVAIPPELFDFGLAEPLRTDAEGYVHVPGKPGLGVEIDWALLDRHTVAKV